MLDVRRSSAVTNGPPRNENLCTLDADRRDRQHVLYPGPPGQARGDASTRFPARQQLAHEFHTSANGKPAASRKTASASSVGLPAASARTKPCSSESGARLPLIARASTRIAGAAGLG